MKRLRDESSSDFVKSLLDSAALDAPSPGAEERALRSAEREVLLPKSWPKGWVIGGTVVGIGALLLLLGQAYQGGKPAPAPAAPSAVPAVDSAPVAEPPPATPVAPVSAAPVAVPPPAVTASGSAASPASAVVRAPPPSAATASAGPAPSATSEAPMLGLRDELALIDAARTSLAAGAASSALETLARYDARYPAGQLREEATAVRVEALFAAGRSAEARTVGERFLREHPSSTHAQHVRSLLEAHAP